MPSPSPEKVCVAIVDDEKENRDLLRNLIEVYFDGVEIVEATNGLELIALLETISLKVILLDLRMSPENGVAVIRSLITLGRIEDLKKILITTGSTELLAQIPEEHIQADQRYIRPLDTDKLAERIEVAISRN